jgi:hypothetical protein
MKQLKFLKEVVKIKRYSKQGLFTLFLICAFPTHVWTFILVFKDFSMLISRLVGIWGAIGVLAYGLLFALIESIFVLLVAALAGFLISPRWKESQRIALLGFLVTITMLWEIFAQACFIWNLHVPARMALFLALFHLPFGFYYAIILIGVTATTLVPVLLILRNAKFYNFVRNVIERITLLSEFYLFFDVMALIVVIVRNV